MRSVSALALSVLMGGVFIFNGAAFSTEIVQPVATDKKDLKTRQGEEVVLPDPEEEKSDPPIYSGNSEVEISSFGVYSGELSSIQEPGAFKPLHLDSYVPKIGDFYKVCVKSPTDTYATIWEFYDDSATDSVKKQVIFPGKKSVTAAAEGKKPELRDYIHTFEDDEGEIAGVLKLEAGKELCLGDKSYGVKLKTDGKFVLSVFSDPDPEKVAMDKDAGLQVRSMSFKVSQ